MLNARLAPTGLAWAGRARNALGSLFGLAALAAPYALGAQPAQMPRLLLRQPDVSASQICFAFAGDIWLVPRSERAGATHAS